MECYFAKLINMQGRHWTEKKPWAETRCPYNLHYHYIIKSLIIINYFMHGYCLAWLCPAHRGPQTIMNLMFSLYTPDYQNINCGLANTSHSVEILDWIFKFYPSQSRSSPLMVCQKLCARIALPHDWPHGILEHVGMARQETIHVDAWLVPLIL